MFKVIMGASKSSGNGLEGFDMEKALSKIPTKQLAIMTFKQMNDHVNTCAKNSESTLKILKFVGVVVGGLALQKINDVFHFVNSVPPIPGG